MAIEKSKIAGFGGKVIVPAGSQTFDTGGTFSVPVGVIRHCVDNIMRV